MMVITPRLAWVFLSVLSAAVSVSSLLLTAWLNLEPCHLCIFQRLLFMLMSLVALTVALTQEWSRLVARLSSLIFLILAGFGAGVAGYQSWLQFQPINTVSCVAGKMGLIEHWVEWLGQQMPSLFLASGFCEDPQLVILGLSLANAALFIFVLSLAVAIWALWFRDPA